MVFIVNRDNRHLFEQDLLEMHRQRRAVFVDRLGWAVPVSGGLEIDRYDRPDTVYLLVPDERDQRLIASARLLPTVGPHLMLDLFGSLCGGAVPCGPWTWEASRFCPNPDIRERSTRLDLLWQIICGIMETAMLFGMEHITLVANRGLLPLVLECGWDAVRLGDTRPDGDDEMTAVSVNVTQHGLRRVRTSFGISGPIVRFYPSKIRAAAS